MIKLYYQFFKICLIVLVLTVLTGCKQKNYTKSDDSISSEETMLMKADSMMGISLSTAASIANKVLLTSCKKNHYGITVDAWIILGNIQSYKGENDSALIFFNRAYTLAHEISYSKGICRATIEIGDVYYNWGKYDKAIIYFNEALKIAQEFRFHAEEALALSYMGKYYHLKGDLQKTYQYYQRSLSINRELANHKRTVDLLLKLGKYYISQGNLSMALNNYLEAYRMCDRFNDNIMDAEVCNHLGGIYLQIDQPEKSMEFHRKALIHRNNLNNPEGIAKSYNNIGKIFLDNKQFDSAYVYFSHSLDLCQKTRYSKGIVKALTNLGKVRAMQHLHNEEKCLLQQAFDSAKESGYNVGMAESSAELGNYYFERKNSEKAKDYYLLSLQMIKQSNLYEILKTDYQGLYQCYSEKGEFQKALNYHILLSEVEKKLLDTENNRQLAILHISFDMESKEKDNQVLRKDIELKEMTIKRKTAFTWLIIFGLVSSVLLCLLMYRRFYSKKKANKVLENLNLKITKQNRDLEKLNADLENANQEKDIIFSIITHELRNPLYWFQNLAEMLSKNYRTMKPDKVQKTLTALDESAKNAFHLMDNLLNWSRSRLKRITPRKGNHSLLSLVTETIRMHETILQQKEIKLYMRICEHAKVFVDPDLFTCVLRNLISNAIKYTPPLGGIHVECITDESEYIIVVSDSGKGIEGENMKKIFALNEYFSSPGLMQERGSGLGLKICVEFVELNNGKIWVNSEPGKGTTFYFTVPKAVLLTDHPLKTDLFTKSLQQNEERNL